MTLDSILSLEATEKIDVSTGNSEPQRRVRDSSERNEP